MWNVRGRGRECCSSVQKEIELNEQHGLTGLGKVSNPRKTLLCVPGWRCERCVCVSVSDRFSISIKLMCRALVKAHYTCMLGCWGWEKGLSGSAWVCEGVCGVVCLFRLSVKIRSVLVSVGERIKG